MRRVCLTFSIILALASQAYSQKENVVYVYDTVYVCIHDTLSSRWAKFDSFLNDSATYVSGVFSVLPPYQLHFYKLWTTMNPTIVVKEWSSGWDGYLEYRNGRVKVENALFKIYPKQKPRRPFLNAGFFYSSRDRQNLYLIAHMPISIFAPFSYFTTRDFGFGMNVNIDRFIVKD